MSSQRKRACVYCRISEDREGLENGVGTQEADCLALAETLRYDVRRVFIENDISASTLTSKVRPEFEAMLKAVEAGEFQVIISLTNGRLTRRPMELERLISLHDQTGVLITTVKSGTDDLSTADGRMVARIKASVDAAEAERTSERVARDVARRRDAGEVHGGPRMFGYIHPTGDNGLRYLQELDPLRADAVQRGAAILLNGGTIGQVMALWNEMGATRPNGTKWLVHSNVQSTLKAPKLAGYTSKGGVAHVRGNWPPIIDIGTHHKLVEILGPKHEHRPKPRRHLLPGFIWCECGTGMVANVSTSHKLNRYLCRKQRGGCGKVSRSLPWVEQAVREFVSGRLSAGLEVFTDETNESQADLEAQIEELEQEIGRLRNSVRLGVFTAEEIAGDVIAARRRIGELRDEQGSLAKEAARPVMSADDTLRLWLSDDRATLGERREILARHVDKIIVHPLPSGAWGANKPVPADSITIVPVKRPVAPALRGPAS